MYYIRYREPAMKEYRWLEQSHDAPRGIGESNFSAARAMMVWTAEGFREGRPCLAEVVRIDVRTKSNGRTA